MRFCVYILKSKKDGNFYIGKTNDVNRRVKEHNRGNVSSTKSRTPLILLETIGCKTEEEALALELLYKKGYMREELKKRFKK